jgi:hypothetical protein
MRYRNSGLMPTESFPPYRARRDRTPLCDWVGFRPLLGTIVTVISTQRMSTQPYHACV